MPCEQSVVTILFMECEAPMFKKGCVRQYYTVTLKIVVIRLT